jgi:transcriptional regulator with XRE-family HTH domain
MLPVKNRLGKRIKIKRAAAGLTRKEMSLCLGGKPSARTIFNVEMGSPYEHTKETLRLLRTFLKLDPQVITLRAKMVRYYGYYSNVSRGKRKETEGDGVPCILEADQSSKEYRKNWARLIQKIYEVDPLTCPKCQGIMRIISFIEDRVVIKAILKHLGLWLVKSRPIPKAHAPPALKQSGSGPGGYVLDHFSQLSLNDDHLYRDPDYPWEAYLQS